jgi:hypothetical protein
MHVVEPHRRSLAAELASTVDRPHREQHRLRERGRLVTTSTAATAPTAAAVSATTSAALDFWTGFVDVQRASPQLGTVQGCNGFVSIFSIGHLHKAEAARAAGVTVGHDADPVYLSVRLEHPTQFFFRSVEVKIPNENVLQADASN